MKIRFENNEVIKTRVYVTISEADLNSIGSIDFRTEKLPSFIKVTDIRPAEDMQPFFAKHSSTFQKCLFGWFNFNPLDEDRYLEDGRVAVIDIEIDLTGYLNSIINKERTSLGGKFSKLELDWE